MCSHLLAVRETESLRGKILNKNKIETMGKKRLTECLVKVVKKCFLKKLSVWLALIKMVVCVVNYQKGQCICKELSKRTFKVSKKIIFFSPILTNNNLSLKIYCENIVIAFLNFNFSFFILFFPYFFTFFFIHISFFFFFFFPLFFSSTHTYPSLFFFSSFPFFPTTSSRTFQFQ